MPKIIDESKLTEYEPMDADRLRNFERVFHIARDNEKSQGTRRDVLNTTDTLGRLLKYVAHLEKQ